MYCCNSYSNELNSIKEDIEIGIIIGTSNFIVGCSNKFSITDASNKKLKFSKGILRISCDKNGIYIADKYFLLSPIKIKPSNNIIFVESKPYRGYLIIKKFDNKLNIINVLNIDDYVRGVLYKEAGNNWNEEALKAHAVISRTYAVANLSKHSSQGFDLCSTTHCQVYDGIIGIENNAYNKALLLTECEFLTYNDKFANTVFHASCGGHTESPQYIWNCKSIPPYLQGVKCDYCKDAPYSNWEQTLNECFIRTKLSNNNFNIGKIKKIKIKGKTITGATNELEIFHSNGKLILNAYQFRIIVDALQIKSHYFYHIERDGDNFCFKGKGWGHKVGLCQWGAKTMAENGKSYKDILSYFYPGTEITKITYKR
ncbi:MAG: SpoIID/LytB domain-containing protein [Endomicrobium sp.]|jgi:stage II sporulation protein D|nr:SpoIID/LytB domain-containing protein [Endomicrobium sp.]